MNRCSSIAKSNLDEEEKLAKINIMTSLEYEKAEQVSKMHKENLTKLASEDGVNESVQQEILEKFNRQMEEISHMQKNNFGRHQDAMKAKLKARLADRTRKVLEGAAEKCAEKNSDQAGKVIANLSASQSAAEGDFVETNSEIKALQREHSRQLAVSKQEQLREAEELQEEMGRQEKEEEEKLERNYVKRMEKE